MEEEQITERNLHWPFPPIQIDHAAAVEKFRAAGKTLHLLKPGAVADF